VSPIKDTRKVKKRKVSGDQPVIEKFSMQTQPTTKKRKVLEKRITVDSKGYEVVEETEVEVEDDSEPIPPKAQPLPAVQNKKPPTKATTPVKATTQANIMNFFTQKKA